MKGLLYFYSLSTEHKPTTKQCSYQTADAVLIDQNNVQTFDKITGIDIILIIKLFYSLLLFCLVVDLP